VQRDSAEKPSEFTHKLGTVLQTIWHM